MRAFSAGLVPAADARCGAQHGQRVSHARGLSGDVHIVLPKSDLLAHVEKGD